MAELSSRLMTGVPMQKATCECGHEGKSQNPEHYRCGHCYYQAKAWGNHKRIVELQNRIAKLAVQAETYQKKAKRFRRNHPRPGTAEAKEALDRAERAKQPCPSDEAGKHFWRKDEEGKYCIPCGLER